MRGFDHATYLQQVDLGRRLLAEPDEPFTNGDYVIDERDQQIGYVNSQRFRPATRSRSDEPGEAEGWDIEVIAGDGSRCEIDAEFLTLLDESEITTSGTKREDT